MCGSVLGETVLELQQNSEIQKRFTLKAKIKDVYDLVKVRRSCVSFRFFKQIHIRRRYGAIEKKSMKFRKSDLEIEGQGH